jgi:acyl-CoA thioester hydrolase
MGNSVPQEAFDRGGKMQGMSDGDNPARVRVQRRVEWAQTDAAGHQHWISVLYWAEEAETVLHERLGIADRTFGREPRVQVSFDFTARLWFRDVVDVEIAVERVGSTSVAYRFDVARRGEVAARGTLIAVHIDPATGRSVPWPDDVRVVLLTGGEQRPEQLSAVDGRNPGSPTARL